MTPLPPRPTAEQLTAAAPARVAVGQSALARRLLIGVTLVFLLLLLFIPLVAVFTEALRKGFGLYLAAIREPVALSAIRLTLVTAAIAVPCNTIFGIMAAYAIAKFRFPGRSVLITLIDLPFAVSPVVAGLIYVLIFGRQGWIGPWLQNLDFHYPWLTWHGVEWVHQEGIKIIFATPGIVLSTIFVTFPFVARELIPLMETQGNDDEYAALSLGANPWRMFWRVTLPNIRWGLIYGVILCNARAMGEFGAVSVVSGHIRGLTNTIPLHVEILYNEYQFTAAFAVASLLAALALVTLVLKQFADRRLHDGA